MSKNSGMAMMPWFHRDFLAATQGWTAAETGAYFLLLGAQWEMGPLPEDLGALAAIARATPKEFKPLWRKIKMKFLGTSYGLINQRLEQHRRRSQDLRDQHRLGARQTNVKRWGDRPQGKVVNLAERVAERSLSDTLGESLCVSPPSPSPSLKMLTKGESYLRSERLEGEVPRKSGGDFEKGGSL